MVLVQKWPFFQLSFLGNIVQEIVFYDILRGKNAFLGYKRRFSKTRKIHIFQNGLTHGFGPKMAICSPFFFTQYRPVKCVLRYSRSEKQLF